MLQSHRSRRHWTDLMIEGTVVHKLVALCLVVTSFGLAPGGAAAAPPHPGANRDHAAMEAHSRKVFTELRAAAELGDLAAQKQLAFLFMMMSTASEQDVAESGLARTRADAQQQALHWLRAAARQGDLDSQFQLGILHMHNGHAATPADLGVADDLAEAKRWFTLAAEQGERAAQYNLSQLFLNGAGTERDLVQAYKWHYLATRGQPDRTEALAGLASEMTPEQLGKAERLAHEWLDAHAQ